VNVDTMSGALRLLKCINFKFICLLNLWSKILSLVDRISKCLKRWLDVVEIVSEVESFKFQTAELLKDPTTPTPMELLQLIHTYSLQEMYPNIEKALRIFLTLPVTV